MRGRNLRVVADTNILVSAYFWKGNEYRLLELARVERFQLVLNPAILSELERVLERFGPKDSERSEYLDLLWRMAEVVDPVEIPELVEKDPSDNMLFAAALEGRAGFIVTGDKEVLKISEYRGVQIVRTGRALDLLGR